MSISFVNNAGFTYDSTANTDLTVAFPTGISENDVMIACYGNVGNYRSVNNTSPSLDTGWVILEEVTATTNCYFIVIGKTVDSTDVSNAGTDQVVGTLPDDSGTTVHSSHTVAYSGALPVAEQPDDSNLVHEASPGDATVPTGDATNSQDTHWYIALFNAAKNSATGTGNWTSDADTKRGESAIGNSLTSSVSIFDSGGVTTTGVKNFDGTWSVTPSRLNGSIVILISEDPSDSDTGTGTDAGELIETTASDSDSGTGSETELVAIPISDTESGTGAESESIEKINPTIIADNFNRADENPLNKSSSDHTWTSGGGDNLGVVNNRCQRTP